jgi:hypothetical protein
VGTSLVRKVAINFGRAKALAELLEDEAPKSCDLIWSLLPLEGKPFHSFESGREIFLQIPEPEPDIVPENQTTHQIPGDLFIYYKPMIYIEPWWPEVKRQAAVVAFSYGRDTQVRGTYRPLAVNIVGKIVAGLEQLEDEAIRLRNEGVDKISFTKVE